MLFAAEVHKNLSSQVAGGLGIKWVGSCPVAGHTHYSEGGTDYEMILLWAVCLFWMMLIYPVYMQLLGYAHGITVIIPSDISPDMFGTRSRG